MTAILSRPQCVLHVGDITSYFSETVTFCDLRWIFLAAENWWKKYCVEKILSGSKEFKCMYHEKKRIL